jgi:hypothetical protein
MIMFSHFGYALRHGITYNRKSKPGRLSLWSSYRGSLLAPDPIKNGNSRLLEFLASQYRRGSFFGESAYVDYSLGIDDDLFSILAAINQIKAGRKYSFKNYAGRIISFSKAKVGAEGYEVIVVNVQHKSEMGILALKEIDEFETVTRKLIENLKYSDQEIAERVKNTNSQVLMQDSENTEELI